MLHELLQESQTRKNMMTANIVLNKIEKKKKGSSH